MYVIFGYPRDIFMILTWLTRNHRFMISYVLKNVAFLCLNAINNLIPEEKLNYRSNGSVFINKTLNTYMGNSHENEPVYGFFFNVNPKRNVTHDVIN